MDKISIRCPYCAAKLYVPNAHRGSHSCELCRRHFYIDTLNGVTISTNLSSIHDANSMENSSLQSKMNSRILGAPYRAAWIFGTCGALVFLAQLSTVISLFNIRSLVSTYGWGRVPPYRLSYLDWLDKTVLVLSLIGSILSAIAFLHFMYRARKIAELERISSYRWSWRWTVISLFVPFWNLVRPWLGFAEIQKSWRYASDLINQDVSLSDLPFSWHTFSLVISLMISSITGRIYAEQFELLDGIAINSHKDFMELITPIIILAIVDTTVYFLSFIIAMAYLQSILGDMQELQHDARDHVRRDRARASLPGAYQPPASLSQSFPARREKALEHVALESSIARRRSGAIRRVAERLGITFVGIAAFLIYASMSIIQCFAIVAGIVYSFHMPRFIAIIIALFLSWFPLIGSILGVFGAIYAWGWTWYGAVALFFWYYVLISIIVGAAAIMDLLFGQR